MALAARLEQYLTRKGIPYTDLPIDRADNLDETVSLSARPLSRFVQATLLIDVSGAVMAVHTLDSSLDVEAIQKLTKRRLQPLTARQASRLFADCDPGFIPPIGGAYNLPVLVDEDVPRAGAVLLSGGTAMAYWKWTGVILSVPWRGPGKHAWCCGGRGPAVASP